jgi:uncharacterized membrane protein
MNATPGLSGDSARVITLTGLALLAALQWIWHAWLLPPPWPAGVWLATAFSLPLLLAAGGMLARRPSARFWAGVFALLYFCHGITEAWTLEAARLLGLGESALAVLVIVASNWNGLRARLGGRAKPPTNV